MSNRYRFDLGIHHLILIDKTILQKYVSNKLVLVLFSNGYERSIIWVDFSSCMVYVDSLIFAGAYTST